MKQVLIILFLTFLACKAYAWYGVSPYAYCAEDPVNCVDVDGREWNYVTNLQKKGAGFTTQDPYWFIFPGIPVK